MLKQTIEERKEANDKKAEEVKKRIAEQTKAFDVKIVEEMSRQHESMSLTVAKQIELDELRRAEMRQREQEYKERIRALQEWRQERDQEELRELDERRSSLEARLQRSQ